MKKYLSDLTVVAAEKPRPDYVLLRLTDAGGPLPPMRPGQFVEVRVDGSPATFLRRPISINYVDPERNELWLLIHVVGEGTRALSRLAAGDRLNCLFPLGNGFSMPPAPGSRWLLVGGGVGTAPLLYFGSRLAAAGHEPCFLLGGRSAGDLLQLDLFGRFGPVYTTTEDGSMGCRGFVTDHPVWQEARFDGVATCGPKPMMQAVARLADAAGLPCEASLENMMACGLGACLCCVEKTRTGHRCVCTDGPVFNIKELQWLTSE